MTKGVIWRYMFSLTQHICNQSNMRSICWLVSCLRAFAGFSVGFASWLEFHLVLAGWWGQQYVHIIVKCYILLLIVFGCTSRKGKSSVIAHCVIYYRLELSMHVGHVAEDKAWDA